MTLLLDAWRDWSAALDGPTAALVLHWLPILIALAILPALIARGWFAALAIAGLAAFADRHELVGVPISGLRMEFLLPVCAWLMALGAVVAARRRGRALKRAADLEKALAETAYQLDRERLWRRATVAQDESIPDEEIQALVDRVGKKLNAPHSDATLLPG